MHARRGDSHRGGGGKRKPLGGGGERHTNLWEADERRCRHGDMVGRKRCYVSSLPHDDGVMQRLQG